MQCVTSHTTSLKYILQRNFTLFAKKYYGIRFFWLRKIFRIRQTIYRNINKVLSCGTKSMGFATFKCISCWKTHKQYFSCKSKFCTSCSVAAMWLRFKGFLSRWPQHLHTYHSFFTIPKELRRFFAINRDCEESALRMMQQTACRVMGDFFLERFWCKIGWCWVIHSFGADCKRNPHIHFLITWGGIDITDHSKRISFNDKFLPYKKLKEEWKYGLLKECRAYGKKHFKGKIYREFDRLIDFFYSQLDEYGNKKSWFIRKGEKIIHFWKVIKYMGRYLKRPCIAESRIEKYNEKENTITFWYKDRDTWEKTRKIMDAVEFVGLICRHIPDSNFKMVGYFWIFANRCKTHYIACINNIFPNAENTYKEFFVPVTFRERLMAYTGKDPTVCECWGEFILYSITHFTKEGEKVKYFDSW